MHLRLMMKINEINSREDLSNCLRIPLKKLTHILYVVKVENYYKSFEIEKKNGGIRQINAPTGDLLDIQRKLLKLLSEYQAELISNRKITTKYSHGYENNKSIITNAKVHRNKRYVVNLDLANFFDCFHFGRVRGYFEKNRNFSFSLEMATIIAQLTCYNGRLPQGAPTSPIITNLICSILDIRLADIGKKYKFNYTRYVDDLTFSTNRKDFLDIKNNFIYDIKEEVENFGLTINNKKTRILYKDSRQEVTGIVVNDRINVKREYYKYTRAMADKLYTEGKYIIDKCNNKEGTISQLEGRFSYINQLDRYNNGIDDNKHYFRKLNSREIQYQKFLFYKYFFSNPNPLIVTEGKTDIIYLRTALKKHYKNYPQLIKNNEGIYDYKVSFLNKTDRLQYFLGIFQDGADTMKNIFNLYTGNCGFPKYSDYFKEKSKTVATNPVILVFDNEQISKKPLKGFMKYVHNSNKIEGKIELTGNKLYSKVLDNLYLLTNPLINDKDECEIEDLFGDEVLSHKIEGKSFSREKKFDATKFYSKNIFSKYISKNYNDIEFKEFLPMLDSVNEIIKLQERNT